MSLLHVALQEGFSHDEVAVLLGANELFRKSNVTTRLQIGYADSAEWDVPAGTVELTVSLPDKGLSKTEKLSLDAPTYVGVSLTAAGIRFDVSGKPFGYL